MWTLVFSSLLEESNDRESVVADLTKTEFSETMVLLHIIC